jgi:hypothetical protein
MDARGSVLERFASSHNLEGRIGDQRIGSADTLHAQFGDEECFLVGDTLDSSRGDLPENPASYLPSAYALCLGCEGMPVSVGNCG